MNTNKRIITSEENRKYIFKRLTDRNSAVFGCQVLSLETFRQSLITDVTNKEEEFTLCMKRVLSEISENNRYRYEVRFPVFFAQFYEMANYLIENHMDADALPQDLDNGDKKEILQIILKENLNSRRMRQAFDDIEDASDIEIYLPVPDFHMYMLYVCRCHQVYHLLES